MEYLITWSNITYLNSNLTVIPNNSSYPEMNTFIFTHYQNTLVQSLSVVLPCFESRNVFFF